jgi:epoxyqueuosine reductase
MLTSQKLKSLAKGYGADLCGVADIERFEGAPKQCDPRYIMPAAKSMVVLGFRVFRGCYRGIEEGTFFSAYSSMGYAAINHVRMPDVLWRVAAAFEDEGYEAIPILNDQPWSAIDGYKGDFRNGWSQPVSPEKPAPDVFVHMRIAAFCAGLGEIGYSKVFITPEFGPCVRFCAIITEAPLEPDPIYGGPKLCDRCMLCVKNCSGKAISETETVKVTIAGREVEWGKLDEFKCQAAFQGGVPEVAADGETLYTAPDANFSPHEYNPFIASPRPLYDYGRALEGARGCVRACMVHLEQQGKLKNKFKTPFRREKPWKLNRPE